MENELRDVIFDKMEEVFHGLLRGRITKEFVDCVEQLVHDTADVEWNDDDVFMCICYAVGDLIEKGRVMVTPHNNDNGERKTTNLKQWLDSLMGNVETVEDIFSYLPREDEKNEHGFHHIWANADTASIHCDNIEDANIVMAWLAEMVVNNTRTFGSFHTERDHCGDFIVWFEENEDQRSNPELFDWLDRRMGGNPAGMTFEEITNRLPNSGEDIDDCPYLLWNDHGTIFCYDEEVAEAIADWLDYYGFVAVTGHFDREEDERNGEVDEYTDLWYVDV